MVRNVHGTEQAVAVGVTNIVGDGHTCLCHMKVSSFKFLESPRHLCPLYHCLPKVRPHLNLS